MAQTKAESCIEILMSEKGSKSISNTEQLIEKILGFQDQLFGPPRTPLRHSFADRSGTSNT